MPVRTIHRWSCSHPHSARSGSVHGTVLKAMTSSELRRILGVVKVPPAPRRMSTRAQRSADAMACPGRKILMSRPSARTTARLWGRYVMSSPSCASARKAGSSGSSSGTSSKRTDADGSTESAGPALAHDLQHVVSWFLVEPGPADAPSCARHFVGILRDGQVPAHRISSKCRFRLCDQNHQAEVRMKCG